MGQAGEEDRTPTSDTMPGMVVKPVLTLDSGDEHLGELGLYAFPVTIGTVISQSQIVGSEVVDGVLTTHYQTTDADVLISTVDYPSPSITDPAVGDFWVTADHQYVIRFVMESTNGTQAYRYTYLASEINQEVELALSPEAQAQIDAHREALAAGQTPHPTCDTCMFPVPADSAIWSNMMSGGRFLNLSFSTNGEPFEAVSAQYRQSLTELGWTVRDEQESWHVTDGTHAFTIHWSQEVDDEGMWVQVEIRPDPIY
ncbi:MAG: hypothetical protein AAF639_46605 [Chloroflexota bacterium]